MTIGFLNLLPGHNLINLLVRSYHDCHICTFRFLLRSLFWIFFCLEFHIFLNKLSYIYFYLLLFFFRVVPGNFCFKWECISPFPIILNLLNFLWNFEGLITCNFLKIFSNNVLTMSGNSEHLSFFHFNKKYFWGQLPLKFLKEHPENKTLFSGLIRKISCYFSDYLPD